MPLIDIQGFLQVLPMKWAQPLESTKRKHPLFSAAGQRSPKVGHFHLLVSVIQIASVIVRAFSKDRPARTFAWLLRGEHNALQWTGRSVRKPTISWQIAGKEIFCRQRQDKFRSRRRTASQESFFSTHLHICFKRELFRLGCAIAALDKSSIIFQSRTKRLNINRLSRLVKVWIRSRQSEWGVWCALVRGK